MRLSLCWLPLLAAVAAPVEGGCARGNEPTPAAPSPGVDGPNASLAFEMGGTLTLAPGEIRTVTVVGAPAAPYAMAFALLGPALDASLDATTVIADENGRAVVNLRAPDAPAAFRLRASIEQGPSAEIPIAVSDKGFGQVNVLPMYAGQRPVTEWTASVLAGSTCAAIAQTLPSEPAGALVAASAADARPRIENAPVGPNLAVAVRAGHYMWGCTDATNLVAASAIDVKVQVLDKPIDTSATNLDVNLAYAPEPVAYTALLHDARQLLLDAFFPYGESAEKTLLDAMRAAIPAGAVNEFTMRRQSQGWDALVASSFQQKNISLRDTVATFIASGLATEPKQLVIHLAPAPDKTGHTLLSARTLGSVGAAAAGISAAHVVPLTADPKDQLILSGTLSWLPSRYLGSVAANGAAAALPGSVSIAAALASTARCGVIGALLGDIAQCDTACLADACAAAIAARWQLGLDASAAATAPGQITVTASGAVTIDDTAGPQSFDGSWLGSVSDGTTSASVQGDATGAVAAPY